MSKIHYYCKKDAIKCGQKFTLKILFTEKLEDFWHKFKPEERCQKCDSMMRSVPYRRTYCNKHGYPTKCVLTTHEKESKNESLRPQNAT